MPLQAIQRVLQRRRHHAVVPVLKLHKYIMRAVQLESLRELQALTLKEKGMRIVLKPRSRIRQATVLMSLVRLSSVHRPCKKLQSLVSKPGQLTPRKATCSPPSMIRPSLVERWAMCEPVSRSTSVSALSYCSTATTARSMPACSNIVPRKAHSHQ